MQDNRMLFLMLHCCAHHWIYHWVVYLEGYQFSRIYWLENPDWCCDLLLATKSDGLGGERDCRLRLNNRPSNRKSDRHSNRQPYVTCYGNLLRSVLGPIGNTIGNTIGNSIRRTNLFGFDCFLYLPISLYHFGKRDSTKLTARYVR